MIRRIIPIGYPVGDCQTVGCGFAYSLEPLRNTIEFKKLILLNALVPHPDGGILAISPPLTLDEVREIVKRAKKIESYIGHESTAKLLTELLGVEIPYNRAMYKPEYDDYALVVRLKKRLAKPEDIKNITEKDIEFRLVLYAEFEP